MKTIIQNMNEEQQIKKQLISARDYFQSRNYESSKEKLQLIKQTNTCIETNLFLIEHKINKDNGDMVLQALMKLLTQQDIKLYTQRYVNPNTSQLREIRQVEHEYLYWNVIVIALKIGRPIVSTLVANQSSFFYGSFKTKTSLFILSQLMLGNLQSSRIASFLSFLAKYEGVMKQATNLTQRQQQYSVICQILHCRLLLKYNIIADTQQYDNKFNSIQKQAFSQTNTELPFQIYQLFLQAEVQFSKANYNQSVSLLGQIISNTFNLDNKQLARVKLLAENNIGVIWNSMNKQEIAKKWFSNLIHKLNILCKNSESEDTERLCQYQRIQENILYTYISNSSNPSISTPISPSIEEGYSMLDNLGLSESYKLNYRKAQICLNYYHHLLSKNQRMMPWQQIHDNYDTTYYYPNEPYVQQKGKNKNIFHANKRHFYKRFILKPYTNYYQQMEQIADRDTDRKNFQKQAITLKLQQVLIKAQHFLKQALIILDYQIKTSTQRYTHIYDGQYTQSTNKVLFHQHIKFNLSLLSILCYVQISLGEWAKCIQYGRRFLSETHAQHSQYYTSVLTYMMEAFGQLSNYEEAYEISNNIARIVTKEQKKHEVRDSLSLECSCFYESDQASTFLNNMSVLHSREAHIVQTYQYIQKNNNHQRICPNSSLANIRLPLVDLLVHYNLRIQNYSSALQMIKRKRILTMQGVNGTRSLLNITK